MVKIRRYIKMLKQKLFYRKKGEIIKVFKIEVQDIK